MKQHILLIAVILLIASCKQKPQPIPDGGDCAYKTTNYPATIIEITATDSAHSELTLVAVMDSNRTDTLYYSQQFSTYITNEELVNKNIKQGDRWNYQYKQIISGSCTPDIYVLTNQPYSDPN
ncbi:MAG: hypothetical protein POELPBGB_01138 [Bacteroidia bacterium]|nr:hypothetical protein [Bacteroidia bacterium]